LSTADWLTFEATTKRESEFFPRANKIQVKGSNMKNENQKPSVILVHGAWADGSSWGKVISALEGQGYDVTAVQNPLKTLAEDVATTKRAIDSQKGNVVLVGHSYGGAVITEAGAGNAKVKALVYVAAFAPDMGETLSDLVERYPHPPVIAATVKDSAGFVFIDREKLQSVYANDLSKEEAKLLAATQKPLNSAIIGGEPIKAVA
jgi:pimeloyl-ACP methyl ester carboxylesterase